MPYRRTGYSQNIGRYDRNGNITDQVGSALMRHTSNISCGNVNVTFLRGAAVECEYLPLFVALVETYKYDTRIRRVSF